MSFSALSLNSTLVNTLAALGYESPTPIQLEAIPAILAKRDVMAGAQTGTGKTAAFALPILHHLMTLSPSQELITVRPVRALVLVPTRELAVQVQQSFVKYAKGTDIRIGIAYGGVSIDAQVAVFNAGIDVLIATPGRLLDHLRQGALNLKQLSVLVFDEADRMLDMGFMDEIQAVLKQVPSDRQTLLFSATLDAAIFSLSKTLLRDPKLIEVAKRNTTAAEIEQVVYAVDADRKTELVSHLVRSKNWHQVLIFSRTKQGVDKLVQQLNKADIITQAFHGDLSQGAREKVLQEFKQGKIQVLVATDVAARGLDIVELKYVINFELPFIAEDYIHRIGRTGRAGSAGLAITLFSQEDALLLEEVEVVLDKRLPQQWLLGFEPDFNKMDTEPRRNGKAAQKQRAKKRALGGKGKR
ncbi:DEAD/DEAH box helicase [Shewanella sp. SW36]|uniref:DEAD/DEAH box helicase n=1 Tax=Shewanella oncorhynchi TaxID=2726434 RepID=A0AA50KB82_9GAMM|nr:MULTISPECIES: DEAD/DEAH box helicase [Shewanella]MCU7974331.1 DEAD/DEAH box helicase [Shewanella sp. SW36]MCU7989183.1 DEAD/DEAH box helicase [Shewanella sp. SW1]MCU8050859.1 DEAD/DEAH box helicase [Shewanella sp. SM43]MCU8104977.1 DEAD/DEAH box helicase [Shewanella sp. SM101]WMB71893.1 DEAD/DEAH box helicase [Shewanella oncorhynchi]